MNEAMLVKGRVQRGAALLDKTRPNWYKPGNVNADALEMSDPHQCVLGQVFKRLGETHNESGYGYAVRRFDPRRYEDTDWESRHGFDGENYPLLERYWQQEIRVRRLADKAALVW